MTEVIVPLTQVVVRPEDVDDELGWQDQALCAQTDPGGVLPREGRLHPGGQAGLPELRCPHRVP